MKRNNLPYKAFAVLFFAGWLVGLSMAPLLTSSPTSAAPTKPTGMSIDVTNPAPEQLSLWDKWKDPFLDFWFSIPDAIRLRRPDFNYSTKLPPGIAKLIQELCQQEKQNATEMVARMNEVASQNSAKFEADVAKAASDAINTMNNSTKQGADFYRKYGYERYAQNLEKSQQHYNQVYQEMLDFQRQAREDARKAMTEFWQSYLETRFNC